MFNKDFTWFKTAKKLYRKKKLEQPYASLFNYYIQMTLNSPLWKKAPLCHYVFFETCEKDHSFDETVKNLNDILPLALQENFNLALEKFNNLKLSNDDDYIDLFETEDDFVDDNADVIENMLINYISELSNRKNF